ncbi:unnamed protein product [Cyprideis torosa]|uniref:Uncharacterized protein n=1 Tax=Cyprideis torosa TaxID=163714 RepID=A0A7R8W5H8_9CRUS|nr:unnamed protein product [Cyprideis torosa]CAG0885311.1 unnamed protein product [Cyprideis torosa]
MIRVVNAFRQGLDTRYDRNNPAIQAVLQKQASLSKRLSQTSSSIEYADHLGEEAPIPEVDLEKVSSYSHTETAV